MAKQKNENKADSKPIFYGAVDEAVQYTKSAFDEVSDHFGKQLRKTESIYSKVDKTLESTLSATHKNLSNLQQAVNRFERRVAQSEQLDKQSWGDIVKQNLLNNTGAGQKFDPSGKALAVNIGKEVVQGLSNVLGMYFLKPLQQGFNDMSSTFEAEFTAIAGRMGTDRKETYTEMRGAITALMNSSAKSAVDANKELIPELRAVSERGFQGSKAIEVALANSIDKKLLPWLDSSSEAWTNLQFNLQKSQLDNIKGQQLLLQQSKEGNRLLQSGVINSLIDEIAPTLTNIDYNTLDTSKLGPEMASLMEQLTKPMEEGGSGLTEKQAYEYANKMMQVWKDPSRALQSDDAATILAGETAYLGGGIDDITNTVTDLMKQFVGTGRDYGFAASGTGLDKYNVTHNREEEYTRLIEGVSNVDWNKQNKSGKNIYDLGVNNINEKVTRTYEHDTYWRNTATDLAYFLNEWNHGPQLISEIATTAKAILGALLSYFAGKAVMSMFEGGGGGSNLLSSLLGGGGKAAAGLGGGGGVTGMLPTANTSAFASGSPLLSNLGGGLATGAGGTTAAGLAVAGGALAGGTMAVMGTKMAFEEGTQVGKSGNTALENEKHTGSAVLAGTGAVAGAGGAAALIALGASNPIGWVALAVGGLAFLGKTAWDNAHALSGSAEELKGAYEAARKKSFEEAEQRKLGIFQLKANVADTEDLEEKRRLVVDAGLLSEEEARGRSAKELDNLTTVYADSAKKLGIAAETYLAGKQAEDVAKNDVESKKMLSDLASQIDKDVGNKKLHKGDELYNQYVGMMDSLVGSTEDKDLIEKWSKHKESWGDEVTAGELTDVLNGGGDNWFDTNHLTKKGNAQTNKLLDMYNQTYGFSLESDGSKSRITVTDVERSTAKANLTENLGLYERAYLNPETAEADKSSALSKYNELITSAKQYKEDNDNKFDTDIRNSIKTMSDAGAAVSSYAVGTPYVAHDQLAMIHEGEAVLTEEENRSRLKDLLGLGESQASAYRTSATEIVEALRSGFDMLHRDFMELKQTNSKTTPFAAFTSAVASGVDNVTSMMPSIALTRNQG